MPHLRSNRGFNRLKLHKSAAESPIVPSAGQAGLARNRENTVIKKAFAAAAVLVALPVATQAQSLQYPGFYAGIEGGGSWMFNTNISTPFGANGTIYSDIGWAAGGMIGYDFV